jgi:hypothetical protein
MPDSHRRAMPQVTAVDELFGTHTVIAPDHVPSRRHRRRPRGRDGPQDGVHLDPAAGSVSMLMRQAWICAMPRLSLSDSSRPDRWMYRNVESVLA